MQTPDGMIQPGQDTIIATLMRELTGANDNRYYLMALVEEMKTLLLAKDAEISLLKAAQEAPNGKTPSMPHLPKRREPADPA